MTVEINGKNNVLDYISANWNEFEHLMTPEIIKRRNEDPRLWLVGRNTKYNIIKLSGFHQDAMTGMYVLTC